MSEPFDTRCMTVRRAARFEVHEMVMAHYLHKWPAIPTDIIGLCRNDIALGVAVFALPPRETHIRYGGRTLELARLWVDDYEPRNTESWFLSRAVKLLRRELPDLQYLVSYADPSVGHVGTVYKAANWTADGRTDEGRKTPRCDYVSLSNGRRYSRRGHVPDGPFTRVPRVSKARFVLQVAR